MRTVKAISVEAKKAYFAKTRRSNYAASLRLEGFNVQRKGASDKLPTKESLINHYRKVKA